mgnify:CR=1 FL=1
MLFILFYLVLYLAPIYTAYTPYPINSKHIDLNNYYHYQQAFDHFEINKIRSMVQNESFHNATLLSCPESPESPEKTNEIRISHIQWIQDSHKTQWLYQKILRLAKQANDAMYHFKLTHIKDIQYTRYNNHGKYDWHVDLGKGDAALRKLSMVMLLSNPADFEGGALELRLGNGIYTAPLKQHGDVVFFPSYILHRVLPVIEGTRESLVVWVNGYPFQ